MEYVRLLAAPAGLGSPPTCPRSRDVTHSGPSASAYAGFGSNPRVTYAGFGSNPRVTYAGFGSNPRVTYAGFGSNPRVTYAGFGSNPRVTYAGFGSNPRVTYAGFGSLGRPRMRSPTMLRWICDVPPQIVSDRLKKKDDSNAEAGYFSLVRRAP